MLSHNCGSVCQITIRHFSQLKTKLKTTLSTLNTAIGKLTGNPRESHLVHLYTEQFSDYKGELGDVCAEVLSLMVDESGDLNTMVLKMDQEIFNMSLETKRLLCNPGHAPEVTAPTAETRGVKLIHQTHV